MYILRWLDIKKHPWFEAVNSVISIDTDDCYVSPRHDISRFFIQSKDVKDTPVLYNTKDYIYTYDT